MKTMAVIAADLSLLISVTLAHLIVWRTIRRRYREKAARRKNLKLLRGEATLTQAEPDVGRGFGARPRAIVNSSGGSQPEQ